MLPASAWRDWIKSFWSRYNKLICLFCALWLIYLLSAYPIMRWFKQWPAPIWFSYGLSAVFIGLYFGVSPSRKVLLMLLSPLAGLAQGSHGPAWRWAIYNVPDMIDNRYFSFFSAIALDYVQGALALTLFLLAAKIPTPPRLNLIVGLVVFASLHDLLSGVGHVVSWGAGSYDEYGYVIGQYSLFATVIASLVFEHIVRESPKT